MARKARQRISYVLPLANSAEGHRLGVNGLAVDAERSILYTGGRDGLICAWNLNIDPDWDHNPLSQTSSSPGNLTSTRRSHSTEKSPIRKLIQAHTHWVNDIILAQSNSALVSASSDITVKVWRPHSEETQLPTTIGIHSDYVKCLASPGLHSSWVASGGLDHKIKIWDLNGGGEKLSIHVGDHQANAKGSVYALSVRGTVMASGGPESIARLWDSNSGKRITSLVGHTDNIRDILIAQDSDTAMTASSDQTVKVWSITAGRCMHTLTMHNDSVWSLFSDHPQLSVFYSSDRSGLVAKTDVHGCADMDDGLSLAIAQEHDGVNKVIAAGGSIWTATSSSSINRWKDVDTTSEIQPTEAWQARRTSSIISQSKVPSPASASFPQSVNNRVQTKIPLGCILRLSNNSMFPGQRRRDSEATGVYPGSPIRRMSEVVGDQTLGFVAPYHELPEETIEGQNGLIKHIILNDRRRVLTLDTAGEVTMWDLLQCIPIQSFGKCHLEDVIPQVNSVESVANWCGVDTRTGRLACVLEENFCFDAEMYADDLGVENAAGTQDDHRINLGKWVLRSLFANLIKEELQRDEAYRKNIRANFTRKTSFRKSNPSSHLRNTISSESGNADSSVEIDPHKTPCVSNSNINLTIPPGLTIGIATPHPNLAGQGTIIQNHTLSTSEEQTVLEKQQSNQTHPRLSSDRSTDYFSSNLNPKTSDEQNRGLIAPSDGMGEVVLQYPLDAEKEEKTKEGTTLFGMKFRMAFPKKLGRSSVETKPVIPDEKSEESDKSESKEDKGAQDSTFFGTVQSIRDGYDEQILNEPSQVDLKGFVHDIPNEPPILSIPGFTTVIIQEDRPDSGGLADLYKGTVETVGQDADFIERIGPRWLGDLLLKDEIPLKEISKVSFVLLPFQDLLPSISGADGNVRLSANRMLRAKKILAHVADRIEPQSEIADPHALKPEDYLELYCHNQLISPLTTLGTLRSHVWKTGGDVILYYKSNGKKTSLEKWVAYNTPAAGAHS